MPEIKLIINKNIELVVARGRNLYEVLAGNGLVSDGVCGGGGVCGKCGVRYVGGAPEPTAADGRFFSEKQLNEGYRLSCTAVLNSDAEIAVGQKRGMSIMTGTAGLENLPTDGEEGFGIAADIGTTTVAVYLVELKAAGITDYIAEVNVQRPYGADVISRIKYTSEVFKGLEKLHSLIIGQLNSIVTRLCERNKLKPSDIVRAAVAGNNVMQHIFVKECCTAMGFAPYTPAFTEAKNIDGTALGLVFGRELYILPSVSAFVGGDITAGLLLAQRLARPKKNYLLLDLGTNGELAVIKGDGNILAAATAAGPAFEGGGIECGSGALTGAVSKVVFDGPNISSYSVIGGGEAKSVCGSGVIDILSGLVRAGVVDETGYLDVPDKKYYIGNNVYFSQSDVRCMQLAKAAVAAGVKILLDTAKLREAQIEKVFLSGGFGSCMDAESALNIGLVPASTRGKIVPLGNSAAGGCIMCLVSGKQRAAAESLAGRTVIVPLAERKDFNEIYAECMFF